WLACAGGAALAAAVPVVASTLAAGGVLPDAGRTLPVLEAGLAWGMVCGVLVAPLAVVVHRHAGARPHAGSAVADEPWPAPVAPEGSAPGELAPEQPEAPDAEQPEVPDAEQAGARDADDAPGPDDARHRDEVPARS
ncbi:hypothetical protein G8C93_09735, partial [Cellulosimicrobium cellulans]|nr:hypothetical protein [Cellulosimicrobium cellulans]